MTGQDNPFPASPTPFASREPTARPRNVDSLAPIAYPMYEMDAQACRQVDSIAIEEFGIAGVVLMENAASALCRHAVEMLDGTSGRRVEIYCGPGNNAGDGFALARHLHNHEIEVALFLLTDPAELTGDAKVNLEIIQHMKLALSLFVGDTNPDSGPVLVVDAIFGTGLSRPPAGKAAAMIRVINARREGGARVLAVDVPSGLDAQTGEPMAPCVVADRTVTFAALKSGFAALDAQPILGHVVVEDIGVPIEVLKRLGTRMQDHPKGETE